MDLARTLTDEALRLEQPLVEESKGKQAVNEHLYESLHQIVKALQAKDFSLALEWIDRNKEALQTRQSPLEFALYRAEYLQLLREGEEAHRRRQERGARICRHGRKQTWCCAR